MPTNRFYNKVSNANLATFVPKLARFLINDLATFTGPGWTCIFTYSSAAGTPFEVPADPTNMDSLAADNGWRTGTLVAGDYCILQSVTAPKITVGIEYTDATHMSIIHAPRNGFDTAAHKVTMDDALNWTLARNTLVALVFGAGAENYSIVADEDRFILACEDGVTYTFIYVGKIDNPYTLDVIPSVIYALPGTVYSGLGIGLKSQNWLRISEVNLTTEVLCYGMDNYSGAVDLNSSAANILKSSKSNEYRLLDILIVSTTAGHYGVFGKLRGVYASSQGLGSATGTTPTKTYAYISSDAARSPVVFDWDGVTNF